MHKTRNREWWKRWQNSTGTQLQGERTKNEHEISKDKPTQADLSKQNIND